MKFYGEPNLSVFTTKKIGPNKKRVKVCEFDSNGEFETNDEKLINKLKIYYRYDKPKLKKEG